MKLQVNRPSMLLCSLVLLCGLLACSQDKNGRAVKEASILSKNKSQITAVSYTETLEIFKVEGTKETKKPTVLIYKDKKEYDDSNQLSKHYYYSVDNKLKAYETIKRGKDVAVSNYNTMDNELLAIYEMEYEAGQESKRSGYDGKTKELLRTETYRYDSMGNRISKIILNEQGQVMQHFEMGYDDYGNETSVKNFGPDQALVRDETFEIVNFDNENRWLEKWGYIKGQPNTFQRRIFQIAKK